MPKFNRGKRNYLTFQREWKETVIGKISIKMELREIMSNVRKEVEPDLKNLKMMDKVWALLDWEYGQVKELIN